MNYITFVYKWSSRELRKIIMAILKSWIADNVKNFNYIHNYLFKEKNIEKTEEKIVLIHTDDENKLLDFLSKNFPQIEKLNIN